MGQRSDEIKKQIDEKRGELSENLEKLEDRVKGATDWRHQVDQRPMLAVGLAFGGGLLLSTLVPTSVGKGRKAASGESLTPQKRSATGREMRKAWSMLDNMRAALVALGANKLKEYLSHEFPGFEDFYRKTEEEQRKRGETAAAESPVYSSTTSSQL